LNHSISHLGNVEVYSNIVWGLVERLVSKGKNIIHSGKKFLENSCHIKKFLWYLLSIF